MTMKKLASFKSRTHKPMELIGKTVTIALVAFCAGALLLLPVPVFLREEIERFCSTVQRKSLPGYFESREHPQFAMGLY
jgi:hypothetical protein